MTLDEWMAAEGLKATDLSEKTGFHRTYVWKVRKGLRPASREFIERVIKASDGKVDASTFFAPEAAS